MRILLNVCEACKRYRARLLFLRRLFRAGFGVFLQGEDLPGIGLPREARARLLQALAMEGLPPAD